jgi:hypothetical protein
MSADTIQDLKCCGNCHYRESHDEGFSSREYCDKSYEGLSSCRRCDEWRFDGISSDARGEK